MGNTTEFQSDTAIPAGRELYYQCQRCTACCRWPGLVRVSDAEIDQIAEYLQMSSHDFIDRYTRLRPDRKGLSLIEKENHECVFLEGNDCAIQAVKPSQCAAFPNGWNFPGWRDICEAVPVLRKKPIS